MKALIATFFILSIQLMRQDALLTLIPFIKHQKLAISGVKGEAFMVIHEWWDNKARGDNTRWCRDDVNNNQILGLELVRLEPGKTYLGNNLLTCLIACKVVVSVFNRTELTPTDFVVLLVAACVFHMGMVPIAQYITGQKTITMRSFYNGIKVRRDNTCYVIWTLTFSVFFACSGAAIVMTVGS